MPFDPDAAATPGSGIYGLPSTREESRIVLIPVPFDATTSYRPGTAKGPKAIFEASMQVDLLEPRFGRVYEKGLYLEKPRRRVAKLSREARELAQPIINAGGVSTRKHAKALARVNAMCEEVHESVYAQAAQVLQAGKVPALIGGEHSVSFGAIRACAERHTEFGVLQLDAHMDFRPAFEGFTWSHASIMHNVLTRLPEVTRLVQIGIRDFGEGEWAFAKSQGERVSINFDHIWAASLAEGRRLEELAKPAIERLPGKVYVSIDIDGLDPSLCPHTGTPVPGGLSFHQARMIIGWLKDSGRQVVGFDLVEVAPGNKSEPEWDANVGARILYAMCGLA